jgi:hypothetical protein
MARVVGMCCYPSRYLHILAAANLMDYCRAEASRAACDGVGLANGYEDCSMRDGELVKETPADEPKSETA